ncbi:hypothetical protein HN375_01080 [bacterium]|nr:hypothetical protein [bacterium]
MNENQGGERQMFEGNWTCSSCNAAITQLPFQPDPAREGGLVCRDCHKKRMEDKPRRDDGPRQMHQGDWKCAGCGGAITELPFEPDPARADQLKCRDCFRK